MGKFVGLKIRHDEHRFAHIFVFGVAADGDNTKPRILIAALNPLRESSITSVSRGDKFSCSCASR